VRALLLLVVVAVAITAVVVLARLRQPAPPPSLSNVTVEPGAPAWAYFTRAGAGLAGFGLAGEAGGVAALNATRPVGA
jgi:hypothetical protein